MPSAIILIADGTEEIEFVTPYDVLTRAGVDIVSVGVDLKSDRYATCSRNVKIVPDHISIDTFSSDTLDALILPGGAVGAKTFCENKRVQQVIRQYYKEGKIVATICAAATALVASIDGGDGGGGDGEGKFTVTSHPSVKEQIVAKGWPYSEARVVKEGKVITSRGPGTAIEFSLALVEALVGPEKRKEVADPMVCHADV